MNYASRIFSLVTAAVVGIGAVQALTLDELVARFDQATSTLRQQHKASLKDVIDEYVVVLDIAEQRAKKGGSSLVVSAIAREREIVREAGEIPKDTPADLPTLVEPARRKYVNSFARAARILSTEENKLKERFTRELDSIERKASVERDDVLLKRVAAERAKLAGAPDADRGFGTNLLKNADFAAGPAGPGCPPEWDNHDGNASVETEDGNPFLYLQGKAISQLVTLPDGSDEIQVSLRLRAPDFEPLDLPGARKAGAHLYLEDAAGKLIKSSDLEIAGKERKWTDLDSEVDVPDGVSQVRLMIFREGIEGGLHVDRVSLLAVE